MARPSNRSVRQRQIVQALLNVMAEHGYEKATTGAIAREAGLTAGLIHYHFATKQDILLGLIEYLADLFRDRYLGRLKKAVTPEDKVRAFIDAHVARGRGALPKAIPCWVTIGAEALRQPEVQRVYTRATRERAETLQGLLTELLDAEGRDVSQARALTAAVLASIEGTYQLACAAPKLMPRGAASATLWQMTRGFIDRVPLAVEAALAAQEAAEADAAAQDHAV